MIEGADDTIFAGRGIDDAMGDGYAASYVSSEDGSDVLTAAYLFGGDDRVYGEGGGDTLAGDGWALSNEGHADLEGGDDIVPGGNRDDWIAGDGYSFGSTGAVLVGGNDRVVGGKGDDWLYGDGQASINIGADEGIVIGGADTFVFRDGYGSDVFRDFRKDDGDLIELHGYRWRDLDSNRDGVLTGEDRRVKDGTGDFNVEGTLLDLRGDDEIIMHYTFERTREDFIFV